MERDLANYLATLSPLVEETAVWENGRMPLHITCYLTGRMPPDAYVSSVRALVFRDDEVLTIREPDGAYHILPGGRREGGESVLATLQRELLEETGWTAQVQGVLAVVHFRHTSAVPAAHWRLYPDFLQLVYVAAAGTFQPEQIIFDEYVAESKFWPVTELPALLQSPSQLLLLQAAMARR